MNHGRRSKRIPPIAISNTSDSKKFTRKDLENACRKVAPSRSDAISKRQRDQIDFSANKVAGAESQLKSLDTGVKVCARKYNECKARTNRLQEQLAKRRDELIELKRERDALDLMVEGNNKEAKKITKLKSVIITANKASEANLHYRLMLNHMHLRQRKNSMVVDAHMSELAATVSSAETEKQRCQKMLGEIESSATVALHEYEQMLPEVEIERAHREQEMTNKQLEVENAETMETWRNKQESNRIDFQQALTGGHEIEKESKMKMIKELEGELKVLSKNSDMKSSGKDSSEEAFMHIKRATGVNSLEEMVEKFTSRQDQSDRLINEKIEAEERLSSAKNRLQASHDQSSQLRSNGSGETELNRSLIADVSAKIEKERSEGKIFKSTNSRLDAVLVGLRQGGMGLYQRLLTFHPTLLDGDAPALNNNMPSNAIDTASDTLEMLKIVQNILWKMLNAVGGIDMVCKSQKSPKLDLRRESISKLQNPNLGENNCRIQVTVRILERYNETLLIMTLTFYHD